MTGVGVDVIEASVPRGDCGARMLSGELCPFAATAGGRYCRLHGGIASQLEKDQAAERLLAMRSVIANELLPEALVALGQMLLTGRDERVRLAAALALVKEAREQVKGGMPEAVENERKVIDVDARIADLVGQARAKQHERRQETDHGPNAAQSGDGGTQSGP